MNFCPKCRKKLVVQDFCVECGADLSEFLNGASSEGDSFGSFDFSALQNANEKLMEQSGLVIENGVLTGYTGKKTSVYIQSTVEEIFDRAFYNNDIITDVTIENGVTVIGKNAFSNCRYLKKIKIPKSVNRIGEYAFYATRLDELLLDEYNESFIKVCLSASALNYLKTGVSLGNFTRNENGTVIVDIKFLEAKAVEYATECYRKEQEERRKRDEEIRRKLEEQRKAEERRRAEEEAKRKAEEEERLRKMREEAEKQRIAEEKRQRELKEQQRKEILEAWRVGGTPKLNYRGWIVLERQGNRALVISDGVIDFKKFNDVNYDNEWSTCSLKKWLNDRFIYKLGTPYKESIISVNGEKVFLLSADEVRRYFPTNESRKCKSLVSSYGMPVDRGLAWWWLRTKGESYSKVAYVDWDGNVNFEGASSTPTGGWSRGWRTYNELGVRPAMWIDLDKLIASI